MKVTKILIPLLHGNVRTAGKSLRNLMFPVQFRDFLRRSMSVEISTVCNARCVFCNYRLGLRAKRLMSFGEFSSVAPAFFGMGYRHISFTSMGGDPFTNRDAISIFEAATAFGFLGMELYTNGIAMKDHDLARLLTSGIESIHISFPGFDTNVYEKVYGVARGEAFLESVRMLVETHRRLDSSVRIYFEPRTYLSVKQILDADFVRDFLWEYLGERICIGAPMLYFDDWCGTIRAEEMPIGMRLEGNPLKSIWPLKKVHLCSHLVVPGIMAGGDVRLCNCRYGREIETPDDGLFIANLSVYSDPLDLFLARRESILRLFQDFMRGRLPAVCKNCPAYLPLSIQEAELPSLFFLNPESSSHPRTVAGLNFPANRTQQ